MIATVIEFFRKIFDNNDFLTLYVISIIPIIELRGAILFMPGMFIKGAADAFINTYIGMWCCIAGSTTVILPLILATRPLLRKLKSTKLFAKFAKNMESNLSDRAESAYNAEEQRRKDEERIKKGKKPKRKFSTDTKKFWGLFLFVAIPLPMTGAWTGSCVGSFLDFPVWKASLAVFLGNIVAGHILMAIAWFLPNEYADIFLAGFAVLAVALAVMLAYSRGRKNEKKRRQERAKYANRDEYELAVMQREAGENGSVIIKKEYIDKNGDRHIIIGHDESKNSDAVGPDDVI